MKLLCDRGSGSPLALVCALMCDGELYAGQVDRLARRRRVLVFQSEGEDNLREAAAELLAMLGALGLRRFDLGGLSMGGNIVQEAVVRCPGAVKRLVLMDTRHRADDDAARAARLAMIADLEAGRFEAVVEAYLPRLLCPQSRRDLGDGVRAMFRRLGPSLFARQLRMLLSRRELGEALRVFPGRVLCLCGAQDELTPPAQHAELAACFSGARLVVIPGNCGHLAPLEAPRAVADALEAFLEEI